MSAPIIRELTAADARFVADAWCESYRKMGCPKGADPNAELPVRHKTVGYGVLKPMLYASGAATKPLRPSSTDPLTYISEQHALVARIIGRPTTRALIACNAEDAEQIAGFLVFEMPRTNTPRLAPRPIFHYAYTKELFRRRGIARQLVETSRELLGDGATEAWVTHWGRYAEAVMRPLAITFNEYVR